MSTDRAATRIGVLWRGDAAADSPVPAATRFQAIFEALSVLGVDAEPVVFADDAVEAVRERLLAMDGVLVWVDPQMGDTDRTVLDAMLIDVAAHGVWVSAHPEVILQMGTKDVLVRTRHLPWGSDTRLYRDAAELQAALPALLIAGPRVLKRHRGNGGAGVWKVERRDGAVAGSAMAVWVQHGARESMLESLTLEGFVARCAPYFAGAGVMIDQPYQARLSEGMIRCYLSGDRVVGFGHQLVTALLPPPDGTREIPLPPPRVYFGPTKREFQPLKELLEQAWVTEMRRALKISRDELPAIWDADFLLGPRSAGADSYVLCEINVSSVFPIPDQAAAPLAQTAFAAATAAKLARGG